MFRFFEVRQRIGENKIVGGQGLIQRNNKCLIQYCIGEVVWYFVELHLDDCDRCFKVEWTKNKNEAMIFFNLSEAKEFIVKFLKPRECQTYNITK